MGHNSVWLSFALTLIFIIHTTTSKPELLVVVITTSNTSSAYQGARIAESVLKENYTHLFPNHNLNIDFRAADKNEGLVVKQIVDILKDNKRIYAVVGAQRSASSVALGHLLQYYNIPQMSPNSASPELSNKEEFPYFTRMTNSAIERNLVRIKILQYFGWSRIFTVTENYEFFYDVFEHFFNLAKANNITVIKNHIIRSETYLKSAVEELLREDARIVLLFTYSYMGGAFLCEAYQQGFYGDKYEIIFPSNFVRDAVINFDYDCSIDEIGIVANNALQETGLPTRIDTDVKIYQSDILAEDIIQEMYSQVPEGNPIVYRPNGFDAMMTTVLSLSECLQSDCQGKSEEEFGEALLKQIYQSSYEGILGRIRFDSNGNLIKMVQIQKFLRNYTEAPMRIAIYDASETSINVFVQPFEKVPRDERIHKVKVVTISNARISIIFALSGSGIVVSLLSIIINIRFREIKIIKMSSPHFNSIILIGCSFGNLGAILMVLPRHSLFEDVQPNTIFTVNIIAFLFIAWSFSLSFGGLFLKTYRVHVIMTQRLMQSSKKLQFMQDRVLLSTLNILILSDFTLILLSYLRTTVLFIKRKFGDSEYVMETDIETTFVVKENAEYINIYILYILIGYKLLMLVTGVMLAALTRNVKIQELNDSKMIGILIYNVCIASLFCAFLYYFLKDFQPITADFLISVAISITTSACAICMMSPKVSYLIKNKD